MKKLIVITFLVVFGFASQLYAQNCTPLPNPVAGALCHDNILLCCGEIDGVTGTLPVDVNLNSPNPLCPGTGNVPNNIVWYSFVAGSTSLTLQIDILNCVDAGSGPGMQVGVWEDCSFTQAIYCNGAANTGALLVPLNGMIPGKIYHLFLDGFGGSVCDYGISVVSGTTFSQEPSDVVDLIGPISPCVENEAVYTAIPGLFSDQVDWMVTPSDVTFTSTDLTLEVLSWGSAIGGSATICATGINDCYPNSNTTPICIDVNVGLNPAADAFGSYPYCESGYLFPSNGELYPEGNHLVIVDNGNNCDSLYTLTVTQESEPLNIVLETTASACEDDGSITAIVTEGIPPYTYQWSHGPTTAVVNNLYEGIYSLTVTDDNGCWLADTVNVASSLDFELNTTFTDCGVANGSATISATDINDLDIQWSNNASGPMIDNLAIGGYSVTITNQITNCVDHEVFLIEEDSSCYATISGYVQAEFALDCSAPNPALNVSGILISLSDGQGVFTDDQGYYEFRVMPGTYTVDLGVLPSVYAAPCGTTLTVNAPDYFGAYTDNNFNLDYLELPDIKLKAYKPNARPGFDQTIRICVMNVSAIPVTTTITCEHPDVMTFMEANPTETFYDAANYLITWEDLVVAPNTITFLYVDFNIPVGTPTGTPITYVFRTDDALIAVDQTPENNILVCEREITNAFDPNDKMSDPKGEGPEGILEMGIENLTYQIRFQNTGNDTAFTVVLRDTLSEHLDISSIKLGPASHSYRAQLNEGNILEVTYDNILLPDSIVNEPASHGFFIFDIDLKTDLPYGTRITNRAGIYFDYNDPIITNTVVNTTATPTSINELIPENNLRVYPNPTSGKIFLSGIETYPPIENIELMNINGSRVKFIEADNNNSQSVINLLLDKDNMFPGLYLLKVHFKNGQKETMKFIFME